MEKKTKLPQKERLNYERECYEIVIYQEVFKKVKGRNCDQGFYVQSIYLQGFKFQITVLNKQDLGEHYAKEALLRNPLEIQLDPVRR